MADESASKKYNRGFPGSPILPKVMPKTAENTTRPKIFVPLADSSFNVHVNLSAKIIIENLIFKYF